METRQPATDFATIQNNLQAVRSRIAAAASRAGRTAAEITLIPVTKTMPEASVRHAYAAGERLFGENKAQEAVARFDSTADLEGIRWAVIGNLQRNKAKMVARVATEFHALDSVRVAEALQRRLELEDRTLDVFVQVNTSREESKYGLAPEEAGGLISELPAYDRLNVRGLMTLALFSSDMDAVRPCFTVLRTLRDRLMNDLPGLLGKGELSMGMSGDFELAIQEGATTVRVGQAIFGARGDTPEHYWPTGAPR